VWTSKGWLSLVLIRAGYAQRRTHPAPASLAPPDTTGTSNKGYAPDSPAFLSATFRPVAGDTFEVEQGAKNVTVRLFDVTCEGSQQADASATAARLIGEGPAWVFPCGPQPAEGKGVWPVRIWTSKGWLSDALVQAGQAKRIEDAEKPAVAAAKTGAKPAPKSEPAKRPAAEKAGPQTVEWRPVAITLTASAGKKKAAKAGKEDTGPKNYESQTFTIASGVWRLSWEAKVENPSSRISFQVFRCTAPPPNPAAKAGNKGSDKQPASQIASSFALTGAQPMRTGPGRFWIKVSGATEVTVKVEEAVLKSAEP
jgi:hypothetical protein